jgi:CDP-glycerol glycerophosphotransferase
LNNKNKFPEDYKQIRIVKYLSLKYIFASMTAKFIINNAHIDPIFPFRKDQITIHTWHGGGAYKNSTDLDRTVFKKIYKNSIVYRNIRAKITKYVISSCETFTYFFSNGWDIAPDKFLPIGLPRNDLFFADYSLQTEKVRRYFKIKDDNKIVLYAPTFHGLLNGNIEFNNSLDIIKMLNVLEKRFNSNFVCLFRYHRLLENSISNIQNIISATGYSDMQELLCAADVLITDYSSSIWDFSFTDKPCFLFAPDLEDYRQIQGFYVPPEKWPFSISKTNEELQSHITVFDEEKYKQALRQHHSEYSSYEKGTASEQLCNIILNKDNIYDD